MSVTELEERVYEHGNPVDLAVLGDALASLGDPRGTLIALEATAGHPLWVAKPIPHYFEGTEREEPWRAELLSWAGPALANEIANGCVELRFHAGFIDARVQNRPRARPHAHAFVALRESPVARVLRNLELHGVDKGVPAMVGQLQRGQPWLRRLEIRWWRGDQAALDLRRLEPALPRLEELSLVGDEIATHIPSRIATLRLAGCRALELTAPLPSVKQLDFAMYPCASQAGIAMVSRRWFPALERLDLSRNEPQQRNLGRDDTFVEDLADLDVLPGLSELRLPSLHNDRAVGAARAALARLPATARVAVARAYESNMVGLAPRCAELARDPRVERSPVFPFPPRDLIGNEAIRIDGFVVDLPSIIEYLEVAWASLDEPARTAWRAFWRLLGDRGHGWHVIGELPRESLLTALESCEGMGQRWYRDLQLGRPLHATRREPGGYRWLRLRHLLRRRRSEETVLMEWDPPP